MLVAAGSDLIGLLRGAIEDYTKRFICLFIVKYVNLNWHFGQHCSILVLTNLLLKIFHGSSNFVKMYSNHWCITTFISKLFIKLNSKYNLSDNLVHICRITSLVVLLYSNLFHSPNNSSKFPLFQRQKCGSKREQFNHQINLIITEQRIKGPCGSKSVPFAMFTLVIYPPDLNGPYFHPQATPSRASVLLVLAPQSNDGQCWYYCWWKCRQRRDATVRSKRRTGKWVARNRPTHHGKWALRCAHRVASSSVI